MFAHSLTASALDRCLHQWTSLSLSLLLGASICSLYRSPNQRASILTLSSQHGQRALHTVFVLFGLGCLSCKLFKCPSQLHSTESNENLCQNEELAPLACTARSPPDKQCTPRRSLGHCASVLLDCYFVHRMRNMQPLDTAIVSAAKPSLAPASIVASVHCTLSVAYSDIFQSGPSAGSFVCCP